MRLRRSSSPISTSFPLTVTVAIDHRLPMDGKAYRLVASHQRQMRMHLLCGHRVDARPAARDVLFKLRPKLLERVFDRPSGAVGQSANRRTRHDPDPVRDVIERVEIRHAPATFADTGENLRR